MLSKVIEKARQLARDFEPSPVLNVKGAGYTVANDGYGLTITKTGSPPVSYDFGTYPSVGHIFDVLLSDTGILVGLPPTYQPNERTQSLRTFAPKAIDNPYSFLRSNVVSDAEILELLVRYLVLNQKIDCQCLADVEASFSAANCRYIDHAAYWLAYYLIETRRGYIAGAELPMQWFPNTSDFQTISTEGASSKDGSLSVSVADVFSFSDDNSSNKDIANAEKVGAYNFWGDDGYWIRLQLKIRADFERYFGDFSLQPNQVVQSTIIMDKEQNYFSWFDSYPYEDSSFRRKGC
jgi:hypothetical protein